VTARLGAAIATRRAALDALRATRTGRAALLAVAALAVFTAIGLALLLAVGGRPGRPRLRPRRRARRRARR
jgi:hypothetical protein